jgi:hypothetical protein
MENSPWYSIWSKWLGRTPHEFTEIPQLQCPGISQERFYEFTKNPRRYGLHATIKAPFELNPKYSIENLIEATAEIANRHKSFRLEISPKIYHGFLALTPTAPSIEMSILENSIVQELDAFRAPLQDAQLAKRRKAKLSQREDELLVQYGYPYVLDCFNFHISLTDQLESASAEEQEYLLNFARAQFDSINSNTLLIDSVCIFEEEKDQSPFILKKRLFFKN